jgi:hypothetical protein
MVYQLCYIAYSISLSDRNIPVKFRYYHFAISDNNTIINKVPKYVDSFYLYDNLKMINRTTLKSMYFHAII